MGIRKGTRIETSQLFHTWTDPDHNFVAEVCKEDGVWVVRSAGAVISVSSYQRAVDIVMDEWRLTKSGFDSWEDAAREMAEGDWDDLSDYEQQDLINAVRSSARLGAL